MNKQTLIALISGCLALSSVAAAQKTTATAALTMKPTLFDWAGIRAAGRSFMPNGAKLSETRPAGVTKEPAYDGKPVYGVINVGDGPRAAHVVAIVEPPTGDAQIYVDLNGDGDLTDDGPCKWGEKSIYNGNANYNGTFLLRASYGNEKKETSSTIYGMNLYWSSGGGQLGYFPAGGLTGDIKISGKTYHVVLTESDGDGMFNKRFKEGEKSSRGPVNLDLGTVDADARGTFSFAGGNYLATISQDGTKVKLETTAKTITKPKADLPKPPPELLAVGTQAPDFEAEAPGGGTVKLSDYRGKIVVLDFWATWCGPCQAAMPHLQKVYEAVKGKGVDVLALCVWDDKKAYEKWGPANKDKYSFPLAYDPAGHDDNNIAKSKFNVSGIPTTYVIDKDGKVAASFVGYDQGDHRVEDALSKLGVNVESSEAASPEAQPKPAAPAVTKTAPSSPMMGGIGNLKVGDAAPDFTAKAPDGRDVHLSDFKGRVIVLDFWATWCGPCKASLPHVQSLYEKYKDKGLSVLALNVYDSKDEFDKWIAANKQYTFPVAFDPAGKDMAKSLALTKYDVSVIPATLVIDRDGKVAAFFVGYSEGDSRIEKALAKLEL